MFTEKLALPIDSESILQYDQTLILAGTTWADYEKFDSIEYPGYRVSYFQGVITIVSPSPNHEAIAEVINYLVVAYCRKHNLLYFPMRSTTLKNPPLAGKEPDVSFAFGEKKSLPDLAIEVVFSSGETPRYAERYPLGRRKTQGPRCGLTVNAHQESGGIADLEKYQYLGVKEVWFWQNNQISFYKLVDSDYVEVDCSACLPKLFSDFLIEFINRGLTESPLIIEADFIKELDNFKN